MGTPIKLTAQAIVEAGALEIRDVDKGEEPFLYASGNWGPGYVSIKGLVSQRSLFNWLVASLSSKLREEHIPFDFVAGNATGGMTPGWILSDIREIPFVYVRESRKKGGQKELITGIKSIPAGSSALVVEELVNFAETTCNSASALRGSGYGACEAATILFYGNPEAIKRLEDAGIHMTYLLSLEELLLAAESHFDEKLVDGYRRFLSNPLKWQEDRELKPVERGGTL